MTLKYNLNLTEFFFLNLLLLALSCARYIFGAAILGALVAVLFGSEIYWITVTSIGFVIILILFRLTAFRIHIVSDRMIKQLEILRKEIEEAKALNVTNS